MAKYIFDTYFMNQKTSHVEMDREKMTVVYQKFTDRIPEVPYLFDYPTFEQMYDFLESRCMPKGRECLPEYLKACGVEVYDPYEILKSTHGVMWEDFLWIKFPGEEITWEDVKVRD